MDPGARTCVVQPGIVLDELNRQLAPTGLRFGGDWARGSVLLWPDTFTNHFHPHIGQAAVTLMEHAGWRVVLPEEPLRCG